MASSESDHDDGISPGQNESGGTGVALYSFPQITEDMAQYFFALNKLDLIFAACLDEDSPHPCVDGVNPKSQPSLITTKPVQII